MSYYFTNFYAHTPMRFLLTTAPLLLSVRVVIKGCLIRSMFCDQFRKNTKTHNANMFHKLKRHQKINADNFHTTISNIFLTLTIG